jgi:3-phenylpropionate/cinnamic acid dioxygenase small subunit
MSAHTLGIHDLLTHFFQAFDDQDWPLLRGCLSDQVSTDYSSFRETPPATISADQYVELRRAALRGLDTQHNFLNLRVEVDAAAGTAAARCNYIIHRFEPSAHDSSDHAFHSYGHYVFGFARANGAWRISGISQRLLWSQGNREIHGGIRSRDRTR